MGAPKMIRFGLMRESVNAVIDLMFRILFGMRYPYERRQMYPSIPSLIAIKIYFTYSCVLYFLKSNMLKLLDMMPADVSLKILYFLINIKKRMIRLCTGRVKQQP